jgi:hypothetical protein
MSDERREWLVNAGQEAMQDYFARQMSQVSFDIQTEAETQRMHQMADKMAVKMLSR